MKYSHYSEYMALAMSTGRKGPEKGEYEYLKKCFDTCEEPFLELACGYGRLLLDLMEKGHNIIGTDASPEMLQRCRELAEERKLQPVLHHQYMQRLELDVKFGFIFIADCTFTLVIDDKDVDELINRVWTHLKPGGMFLFDFSGFYPTQEFHNNNKDHKYNTDNWFKMDDKKFMLSRKYSEYNASTQVTNRMQVHDYYEDGKLIGSQVYEDPNRDHNIPWLIEKLTSKGFIEIGVGGYLNHDKQEKETGEFSIRCRKPS